MGHKKRGLGKNLSDLGLSELLGDMNALPAAVMDDMPIQNETAQDSELKKITGHYINTRALSAA